MGRKDEPRDWRKALRSEGSAFTPWGEPSVDHLYHLDGADWQKQYDGVQHHAPRGRLRHQDGVHLAVPSGVSAAPHWIRRRATCLSPHPDKLTIGRVSCTTTSPWTGLFYPACNVPTHLI